MKFVFVSFWKKAVGTLSWPIEKTLGLTKQHTNFQGKTGGKRLSNYF
jgi:hypothetical protein